MVDLLKRCREAAGLGPFRARGVTREVRARGGCPGQPAPQV